MAAPRDGSFTNNFVMQALGGEWLAESDDYARKLRNEGYTTPARVKTLSEDDLKFCGNEKRAHVRAFLLFIQKLAANEAAVGDWSASATPAAAPALPLSKRSSPAPASSSSGGRSPPRYEKRHQDDRTRAYDHGLFPAEAPRQRSHHEDDAARDAYARPAYREARLLEPIGRLAAQPAAASRPPAAPPVRVDEWQPPQPNRTPAASSSWKSNASAPPATDDKPKPAVLTTRPSFATVARVPERKPTAAHVAARFETRLHYPMPPVDEPVAPRPVRRTASSSLPSSSPSQPVEVKSVAAKVDDVLGGVRF